MTITPRIPIHAALPALFALASLPAWAQSISAPGVPHFFAVDERVYRGGQPTDEGWRSLARLGVKTVINLRREGEDGDHSIEAEARAVRAAGMRYVSVPMKGAPSGPTHEQIAKVLKTIEDDQRVFIHCKKGKDRTGTAIACYRIARHGWKNAKALDEAKDLGLHWYEFGMKSYIREFSPARLPVAAARGTQTGASQ